MEQKQKIRGWRLARMIMAALAGFLLLAAHLPNTGAISGGPVLKGMWRCGPFLFYPDAFFGVVCIVTLSTACTLFGVARNRVWETVGWIFLGILVLITMMA
jgi:hypothetical protein